MMPISSYRPLFSALTAGSFLLRRKKKVTKEKATPGSAVGCADFPARLVKPGGCATRAYGPQTVLADVPRLACVARRSTGGTHKAAVLPLAVDSCCLSLLPSASSSSTGRPGGSRRALSEPRRGELRSRPGRPSSAEHPAQPGDAAGAPSSWLLLLGKTRRSSPPVNGGT